MAYDANGKPVYPKGYSIVALKDLPVKIEYT